MYFVGVHLFILLYKHQAVKFPSCVSGLEFAIVCMYVGMYVCVRARASVYACMYVCKLQMWLPESAQCCNFKMPWFLTALTILNIGVSLVSISPLLLLLLLLLIIILCKFHIVHLGYVSFVP
jgi:hypothetical protein